MILQVAADEMGVYTRLHRSCWSYNPGGCLHPHQMTLVQSKFNFWYCCWLCDLRMLAGSRRSHSREDVIQMWKDRTGEQF